MFSMRKTNVASTKTKIQSAMLPRRHFGLLLQVLQMQKLALEDAVAIAAMHQYMLVASRSTVAVHNLSAAMRTGPQLVTSGCLQEMAADFGQKVSPCDSHFIMPRHANGFCQVC